MSQVIRIPQHIYSRLEKLAEGFDTPANVIDRLLDHYESDMASNIREKNAQVSDSEGVLSSEKLYGLGRDTTKYLYGGKTYGKGRLVLAVVTDYVKSNPHISFDQLSNIFPRKLQGSSGVLDSLVNAKSIFERTGHKRHFLKAIEVLSIDECPIAVCTEWGAPNINRFISHALSMGIQIEEVRHKE